MAIIEDIIASVEPQQTVISRSGIDGNALRALEFLGDGVAQRFRAPGDRVLIDVRGDGVLRGALDFGGRGEIREILATRFTAPCCSARRVISRITDSVNCPAFAERRGLVADGAFWLCGIHSAAASVELAINVRVARDDFDVLARLRERNRIHEFGELAVVSGRPVHCVTRSSPALYAASADSTLSKLLLQIREIERAEAEIVIRIEQARLRIIRSLRCGPAAARFSAAAASVRGVRAGTSFGSNADS